MWDMVVKLHVEHWKTKGLKQAMDNGHYVAAVFIDLSKAFDINELPSWLSA